MKPMQCTCAHGHTCSRAHTYVSEMSARLDSPGPLRNVFQAHVTRAPICRRAGGSGCGQQRRGPMPDGPSLDSKLTGSFQTGDMRTIRQGRNQKSTTYKNIFSHRRYSLHDLIPPPQSSFTSSLAPGLAGEGQSLVPHK